MFIFSGGDNCSVDTGFMFGIAVSIRIYALGVISFYCLKSTSCETNLPSIMEQRKAFSKSQD